MINHRWTYSLEIDVWQKGPKVDYLYRGSLLFRSIADWDRLLTILLPKDNNLNFRNSDQRFFNLQSLIYFDETFYNKEADGCKDFNVEEDESGMGPTDEDYDPDIQFTEEDEMSYLRR